MPFVCTYIPFDLHEQSRAFIDRNPKAFLERSRTFMVLLFSRAFRSFSAPVSPKWLLERFKFFIDVFRRRLSQSCQVVQKKKRKREEKKQNSEVGKEAEKQKCYVSKSQFSRYYASN